MIANLITVFRLVLLAVFVWLILEGFLLAGVVVFAICWALDAVDGLVARKLHEESEAGSLLDKMTDRLLIGTAVVLLVARGFVPVWALWIMSKEVLLLVVLWWQPRQMGPVPSAGVLGKISTLLQGLTIVWLTAGLPAGAFVVLVTAGVGVVTALKYWSSFKT